jgi:hypothetical protein
MGYTRCVRDIPRYTLATTPATANHPASVRERGEMSIVLKSHHKDFMPYIPNGSYKDHWAHDCLAAHAMQMAIEEAATIFLNTERWGVVYLWINERAAANLARLLGEGNG